MNDDNMTAEEVERIIAEQMACLPEWWSRSVPGARGFEKKEPVRHWTVPLVRVTARNRVRLQE